MCAISLFNAFASIGLRASYSERTSGRPPCDDWPRVAPSDGPLDALQMHHNFAFDPPSHTPQHASFGAALVVEDSPAPKQWSLASRIAHRRQQRRHPTEPHLTPFEVPGAQWQHPPPVPLPPAPPPIALAETLSAPLLHAPSHAAVQQPGGSLSFATDTAARQPHGQHLSPQPSQPPPSPLGPSVLQRDCADVSSFVPPPSLSCHLQPYLDPTPPRAEVVHDGTVAELRHEMAAMLGHAEHEFNRLRAESSAQYSQLRSENHELRAANARLREDIEVRVAQSAGSGVLREERSQAVGSVMTSVQALEAQLAELQREHAAQREGVLATLEERNQAIETLEAQLGSVQAQLLTVLQAQMQQRDDVRKLASTGSAATAPLSIEEAEPHWEASDANAALLSSKLTGVVEQLDFGDSVEHREALARRLAAPQRSVAHEFAANQGGMWAREYAYVVNQPARQVRRRAPADWQAVAQVDGSTAKTAPSSDHVLRDAGHDGWTLDDFCARPLAQAAGLTRPEVAMLRLYSGPAHNPLQFWVRHAGGELYTCTDEPYYTHFGSGERRGTEPFLYWPDVAHRTSTGAERCRHCRRPRREHTRQPLHDWSTSVAVLCSAVEKLAMWSPPSTAYRTLREEDGALPPRFITRGVSCCERGFLSATTDRSVALAHAGGRAAYASVLEIGFDYAARGADMRWVSQFPHENEVR